VCETSKTAENKNHKNYILFFFCEKVKRKMCNPFEKLDEYLARPASPRFNMAATLRQIMEETPLPEVPEDYEEPPILAFEINNRKRYFSDHSHEEAAMALKGSLCRK
jgi:hypothetical protein